MTLSVLMITKNSAEVVGEALESIKNLWSELLVDDDGSTDGTRKILRKYGATIVASEKKNLGERKQRLVERATGDWILVLDADERVSKELRGEIIRLRDSKTGRQKAFRILYQNYVFGKPVFYGGEAYSKIRLFRNGFGCVLKTALHEEIVIKFHKATPCKANPARSGLENQDIGDIRGVIHHHSYRSIRQLFGKFTQYARISAAKMQDRFRVPLWNKGPGMTNHGMVKKLFLYGPHMFWARFVKEQGYRDGWRGFILAFAFAYMETLTYCILMTQGHPLQKRKG